MFLRKFLTLFNPSLSSSILSVFLIFSVLPITVFATPDAFSPNVSHDAFTIPDKTIKKSVTGVDSGKYKLVVDNSTISQSLLSDRGIIDLNIEFASGSAKLTDTARKQIEQISIALKNKNLKNEKILIIGHTDDIGSAESNQKLSEKRALQVKKSLVTSGIAEIRLKSSGRGESKPIADNKSSAGRARNRRVTLSRIKK